MTATTQKPKKGDNSWLGVMGVGMAKFYNKKKKLIAICNDTPNAIACVAKNINPHMIIDSFGCAVMPEKDRLENAGWMTLEKANYKKV
jgi:hypothetical protein